MSARGIQILGWVLFILSALGFIVSGLRAGDSMALLGGILFLAGCVVFLLPLLGWPQT